MTNHPEPMNQPEGGNRITITAKSGYMPEPKAGYLSDVLGILFSIFLIFGGLSGRLVLRGTNSSQALVIAGVAFLVWDIVSIFRKRTNLQKAEEERSDLSSRMYNRESAVRQDGRALAAPITVRIACEKRLSVLDFGARLNGNAMTRDAKAREYTGTTESVRNIINFNNLDLTAIFDVDPNAGEIRIELFRDDAGIAIALPENVTPAPEE
ncbi:MAG: hypothetical protein ACOYI8_11040 [Christensenellales bacterium]|jgi:hypothetical protein